MRPILGGDQKKKEGGYAESVASSMASVAGYDSYSMFSKAITKKISINEIVS